jgi:hypothetical protein
MGGKRVGIHKFHVPNSDDMDGVEFMVLGKDGSFRHICEESRILSTIPKSFMCIRIFADVDDPVKKSEIQGYIEELKSTK